MSESLKVASAPKKKPASGERKSKGKTLGEISRSFRIGSVLSSSPTTTAMAGGVSLYMGINIPFAAQILLDANVWLLGTFAELSGESDSNKTALLFEFGRIFNAHMGTLYLQLTESKQSESLAWSIMGYPDELGYAPYRSESSENMQDWQRQLTQEIEKIKQWQLKGAKIKIKVSEKQTIEHTIEKGAFYPVLFGIDSIMGQVSSETHGKIAEQGSPGRDYAVEAASLTKWFKDSAALIQHAPFSVVYINHGKVDKVDEYRSNYRTPGGNQTKFQATYRIRAKRIDKERIIDTRSEGGIFTHRYVLELSVLKTSLGTGDRTIWLPFSWENREVDGLPRQYSRFDWEASIVYFLHNLREGHKTQEAKDAVGSRIDSVVHLRTDSKAMIPSKFYSDTFDIPKTSPVSAHELGKLIQADSEIIRKLSVLLGIKQYKVWDQTKDYYRVRESLVLQRMLDAVKTPK